WCSTAVPRASLPTIGATSTCTSLKRGRRCTLSAKSSRSNAHRRRGGPATGIATAAPPATRSGRGHLRTGRLTHLRRPPTPRRPPAPPRPAPPGPPADRLSAPDPATHADGSKLAQRRREQRARPLRVSPIAAAEKHQRLVEVHDRPQRSRLQLLEHRARLGKP